MDFIGNFRQCLHLCNLRLIKLFKATLKYKKAFGQFFSKPNVWMLFQYLENVYILKSYNTLNFMGGAATDAHFEVT